MLIGWPRLRRWDQRRLTQRKGLWVRAPAKGIAVGLAGLPPGEGGQLGGEGERHSEIGVLLGQHGAQVWKIRERRVLPLWEDQPKGIEGVGREFGD